MKCAKCGAEMTEGFPVVRHDGSAFPVDRAEGDLVLRMTGADMEERDVRRLTLWACEDCGYVEFALGSPVAG